MKTVFITGGVRNSGLAIADRFARDGYGVALTSRREDDAQATAKLLSDRYGVPVLGFGLDLRSPENIGEVFYQVKDRFDHLDAFVGCSANLGLNNPFLETTPESFDSVMNVNIRGNFFCAQEAAKLMMGTGGSILFIGSVHYKGAVYGRACYAVSKGAIASMVHNLAFELAEYGIRVNQIVPGAIRTDRWDGISPEEEARRRANWPLGIESTPEDIANAVYFLSSEEARTITGAELAVDSGVLSCLLSYNGGNHS